MGAACIHAMQPVMSPGLLPRSQARHGMHHIQRSQAACAARARARHGASAIMGGRGRERRKITRNCRAWAWSCAPGQARAWGGHQDKARARGAAPGQARHQHEHEQQRRVLRRGAPAQRVVRERRAAHLAGRQRAHLRRRGWAAQPKRLHREDTGKLHMRCTCAAHALHMRCHAARPVQRPGRNVMSRCTQRAAPDGRRPDLPNALSVIERTLCRGRAVQVQAAHQGHQAGCPPRSRTWRCSCWPRRGTAGCPQS